MAAKAAGRVNWTRLETLAALHSPGSVALKLVNLASLDPLIVASGRSGMGMEFDGLAIVMPNRFAPSTAFLEHHNRRFGFAP